MVFPVMIAQRSVNASALTFDQLRMGQHLVDFMS